MQSLKKPLIILIAITFLIAVVASLTMLFSVKKVYAKFSVYGDSQAEEIQKELDAFNGKNLVFLKLSDVMEVCGKFPYYEITSVKKEYPNVIKLTVEKRAEVFKIENADKAYVLDKDGIILNDNGETEYPRNVLSVDIGDLSVVSGAVGTKIKTSDDELFYSVLMSSQALKLNDSVKSVEISDNGHGWRDAIFKTYTGVVINIWDVDDDGEAKIRKAFSYYETISDYKKTSGIIKTYKVSNPESIDDGKIIAEWPSGN